MERITKITVNRLVTVDDAILMIRELQCHAKAPELVVDFSSLEYARSISTSLFAREFRLCVRDRMKDFFPTQCYGYMAVVSGNIAMDIRSTGNLTFPMTHDGTLVGVHFDAIPSDIKKVMESIVMQGDAISSVSEYPIHPSKETLNF